MSHPEMKEGEVFLGHFNDAECRAQKYETQRRGKARKNHSCAGYTDYPVFISKEEYQESLAKRARMHGNTMEHIFSPASIAVDGGNWASW
jgi:hypothetical protein